MGGVGIPASGRASGFGPTHGNARGRAFDPDYSPFAIRAKAEWLWIDSKFSASTA